MIFLTSAPTEQNIFLKINEKERILTYLEREIEQQECRLHIEL